MSARKLQQEFDKTNKKIAEGLGVFDDIYDKLMTLEINSQKEKLESDLKKEIKKLQRLRDQLKQWLGDSSIKLDKLLIQENRTRIEHAMDQFKDLEKLLKIKQFSNEGLELQTQKRARRYNEPERNDACNYMSDIIEQIQEQNEVLDVELNLLASLLKKAKLSASYSIQQSIDDTKYKVERNNSHLARLDKILRSLENGILDPHKVDDIKDDLEYYVENNQEEDYVEYDDFYDQLEIEDDEAEIEGSLAQMAAAEEDEEAKREELRREEAKKDEQPPKKEEPKKEEPKKVTVEKEREKERERTPKKKPAVVPVLNPPPPLTPADYSNVIKAVNASNAAAAAALALSTTAPGPATVASSTSAFSAPGALSGASASVLAAAVAVNSTSTAPEATSPSAGNSVAGSAPTTPTSSHANLASTPECDSQPHSPIISNTNKAFADTVPRLSVIPQSRLLNPLPFQAISQLLETSLLNCPDSFDAEKPRQYNPVNIHPSLIDYPQEPMYELNSSHLMTKFDNDTLFFCFYYSEGVDNYAKWNAAKELSRRGWVYNTEVNQWFLQDSRTGAKSRSTSVIQREEEESNGTDDGKAKNYKYFDYEKTWLTRRRENYAFGPEIRETFV